MLTFCNDLLRIVKTGAECIIEDALAHVLRDEHSTTHDAHGISIHEYRHECIAELGKGFEFTFGGILCTPDSYELPVVNNHHRTNPKHFPHHDMDDNDLEFITSLPEEYGPGYSLDENAPCVLTETEWCLMHMRPELDCTTANPF